MSSTVGLGPGVGLVVLSAAVTCVRGLDNGIALTPPMGWRWVKPLFGMTKNVYHFLCSEHNRQHERQRVVELLFGYDQVMELLSWRCNPGQDCNCA